MGTHNHAAQLEVVSRQGVMEGALGCSDDSCAARRVISRGKASLVVAVPGLALLVIGLLCLKFAPYPAEVLGEERLALRFCGLVALTTGTAALAASTLLAASSLVRRAGGVQRMAAFALGLGLIVAFVLFA